MSDAAPIGPTSSLPVWALEWAEELRKAVREMDAEDAEAALALALWKASRGTL